MTEIRFELPPSVFAALRMSPAEFAAEMRLAAAIPWYSRGVVPLGMASEIACMPRGAFLSELHCRKNVPAILVTPEAQEDEERGRE